MKQIVITGFGAVTPLGADAPSTWQAMLAGVSGAHTLSQEWAAEMPVTFAAEVKTDLLTRLDRVEARRLDRSAALAVYAAMEAWEDAGLKTGENNTLDPDRLIVCVGTGIGGLQTTLINWEAQVTKGLRRVSPFTIPMLMANAPAANVGLLVGAAGAVHAPVSACASSNEAISLAVDQINLDRCDIALVGGTEGTIHPLPINAFNQMQALSRRNDDPETASRPWDIDRDGFVLAEGATMMVIETLEHAQARGATIYATIAGAGVSNDNHDIVQPEPHGRGQSAAMLKALRASGLTPSDIKHVNAHGTSTPQGDRTEAGSIAIALGDAVDQCVVTSTKSMTGHLLGGAGALETFATAMALNTGLVPPTINITNLEPGLPIDIALGEVRTLPAGDRAALNNSFGFGGSNVAVALTNANITRQL